MGRTQVERRAETRGLLLEAAADLFANKGFHATSAEAVASAAQRTTGALYDHFGNKEGLLVALLEHWIAQTITTLAPVVEGEAELSDRIDAMWSGILRRDSETGDAWLLLEFELWLHAVRDPQLGAVGAERFRLMRRELAAALVGWSDDFDFELPDEAGVLAAQIISMLIGAAFQYRLDRSSLSTDGVRHGIGRILGIDLD